MIFQTSEGGEKDTKDSSYYKKLLKGMKKDFAVELEKLKAHLQREKQRLVGSKERNNGNTLHTPARLVHLQREKQW